MPALDESEQYVRMYQKTVAHSSNHGTLYLFSSCLSAVCCYINLVFPLAVVTGCR